MSINFNKFEPRPGIVNQQGRLPDPYELVCLEVPKIFDQCLIRKCLVYGPGPDTDTTDCELRSDPIDEQPRRYIRSRDFNVKLLSVEKYPLRKNPNFKKIVINYVICFYADYIDYDGVNRSELFEINRTDVISKFYCPNSIAQFSANFAPYQPSQNEDSNIIKLEMVADALEGDIVCCNGRYFIDITLGYFLVVKAELIVQLLVPTYGYCPVPDEPCTDEEPEENACERFWNLPIPKFYPDQNLQPLFSESDNHHYYPYNDEDED